MIAKFEFDSIAQIGGYRKNNPVGPLSLRERVRVRENSPAVANAQAYPYL